MSVQLAGLRRSEREREGCAEIGQAITANQPLWLPAGTYRLTRELVIDYAPLAHLGLQVISDGAVIDARQPAGLR